MFTSKREIDVVERSLVNLIIGCMLLRYFKNSTSVSSPCVQTIKMLSIYLSQTSWNLRFVRVILQRFPFEIPHEQLTLRGWSNLCVYSCTMSLYKMFMIACRQIVHGSVQSCGCRITNGSVGSNRSVSPLAKSHSGYVDSFVGWNVCVQRRNDWGWRV